MTFINLSVFQIWPVAFSLMASFMSGNVQLVSFKSSSSNSIKNTSAITLLGVSNENYQFGIQFIVINISYGIATPIAVYLFLPIFYNLRVTSAYEVNCFIIANIFLTHC